MFLILLLCLGFQILSAQDKTSEINFILNKAHNGIEKTNVSLFSDYLNSRVYISLSDGTKGYFSANQSYYIIQDFLIGINPIKVSFETASEESENPVAFGDIEYVSSGKKNKLKLFISMEFFHDKWRITHISMTK
ncbi:MAG: DUF4783 domain-containing protein [Melioribacteraceae bacterium]|nr:DUF4783 domain-containing protein [Melioribacteraceae bacterium]MDD3557387.1 DUF4783 domain-containing protein [Melioribacteraceae bacterium]